MNFTYNNILFIFPTITYKMTQISDSYTTRHLLVPSRHRIAVIPKHTTKPEDISPGIKTEPQHSPGLCENSPENPVWTVLKQFQKFSLDCLETVLKFSSDCPKTVLKIPKNSYTQPQIFGTKIYDLSWPLSKSQAIKWPLG